MKISEIRKLFPVTENVVYLNNAAESPLNTRVKEKLNEYLELDLKHTHKKPPVRGQIKDELSAFFGGLPADYALVTSTGIGAGIAAAGYRWEPGDNVVIPADEHWNITFPWLALRDQGVDVRLVPVGDDERIDPDEVAKLVDSRTKILVTTAVRFNTGFRADLLLLSEIAHNRSALFMVDGIQGAGVYPINLVADGIDIFACACFKWLLGLPGTGFLYVNKNAREKIEPVLPGMCAAEKHFRRLEYYPDARKYETGTMAFSHFYAVTAGMDLLTEIGIDNVHDRVILLTDRIINGLKSNGVIVRSPVDRLEERSAIVSFTLGNEERNKDFCEKLKAENIIVALRDGCIRVSPNFYNSEDEIDLFLDLISVHR